MLYSCTHVATVGVKALTVAVSYDIHESWVTWLPMFNSDQSTNFRVAEFSHRLPCYLCNQKFFVPR